MISKTEKLPQGLRKAICLWRRKRWLVAATAQVKLSPTKQETRLARVGIPSPSGDWEDVKLFSYLSCPGCCLQFARIDTLLFQIPEAKSEMLSVSLVQASFTNRSSTLMKSITGRRGSATPNPRIGGHKRLSHRAAPPPAGPAQARPHHPQV